ncbi:hypothetical protein [Microbacterium sp. 2FI]|uniref:hypothetical protein n=1 Tax=Microbacterium sp. 2FI TaxID=2502193 RepID=UPI0010F4B31E|nr:hypothetical protein [Microbacterium sp. 2FI]
METTRLTHVDESDAAPLGAAPLPRTDAELSERLWEIVTGSLEEPRDGWASVPGVTALFGAHPGIASAALDLTGFTVGTPATPPADPVTPPVPPRNAEIATSTPAQIDRLSFIAAPLEVWGVRVHATFDAEDIPVEWITDTAGELWLRVDETRADQLRARFRVRVAVDAAREGLRTVLTQALAAERLTLSDFDMDVRAKRRGVVEASGQARLRRGILSAKARARAVVRLDPRRMTATVERVSVRSANPFVALALLAARSHIRAAQGQVIDLNASMPAGVRLSALTVDVEQGVLVVEGRLG